MQSATKKLPNLPLMILTLHFPEELMCHKKVHGNKRITRHDVIIILLDKRERLLNAGTDMQIISVRGNKSELISFLSVRLKNITSCLTENSSLIEQTG